MKISSVSNLKKLLDEKGFDFKKKFGQNFLIDKNILNKIVDLSGVTKKDLVIEIGPGAGALTQVLATSAKKVLAYEIDESLKDVLSVSLEEYNNVDVKYEDFLKSNIREDIKKYKFNRLLIVANLPYYITTSIITKIIEDKLDVFSITVMLQKEVADRFLANPKSKSYNSLSIFIDYNFLLKDKFKVSKNVFIPKPDVDSLVISLLLRKEKKVRVLNEKAFDRLILDSFRFKRKTIRNNLKDYDLDKIEPILIENNLSLSTRAEEIPIEVYALIANVLR